MQDSSLSKRRAARKKVDIDGYYNYADQWYPCKIYDLSVAGAGLKLTQVFIPGDVIRLKIGLKDNYRIVESIVANVDGQRVGIRFDLDPIMRDFLQDVMNSYHKPASLRRF